MNVIMKDMMEFIEKAKIWFEDNPQGRTFTDKKIEVAHDEGDYLAIRWGLHDRAICVCKLSSDFEPFIMGDWLAENEAKEQEHE